MSTTAEAGTYRPAARLKSGWLISKNEGGWSAITSLVQVLSPAKVAMVTLADGTDVNIPHTHEVLTLTPAEAEKAGVA